MLGVILRYIAGLPEKMRQVGGKECGVLAAAAADLQTCAPGPEQWQQNVEYRPFVVLAGLAERLHAPDSRQVAHGAIVESRRRRSQPVGARGRQLRVR